MDIQWRLLDARFLFLLVVSYFMPDSRGLREAEVGRGVIGGPASGLPRCLSPCSDAIHPLIEGVGDSSELHPKLRISIG